MTEPVRLKQSLPSWSQSASHYTQRSTHYALDSYDEPTIVLDAMKTVVKKSAPDRF